MRAALATARAQLLGDDQAAHEAAASGSCPQCTTLAATSFALTIASTALGDKTLMSESVRRAMLAAVDVTEAELRAAGN